MQNVTRDNAGSSVSLPVTKTGVLGKFGSFWRPEGAQEISRQAGTPSGGQAKESTQTGSDKSFSAGGTKAKTAFRDLISQKNAPRPNSPKNAPPSPPLAKSTPPQVKGAALKHTKVPQDAVRPPLRAATSSARNPMVERTLADKPAVSTSARKELPEPLKGGKIQKDREVDDEQRNFDQERRDHGAENAKHNTIRSFQSDIQESSTKSMHSVTRDPDDSVQLARSGVEVCSKSESISSSDSSSGQPGEQFLRSDEQSQSNARHAFARLRVRVGSFLDGDTKVARIAIDLPGGGRLGIKIRFVGNQLEVIFGTDDNALRAALIEDWKQFSADLKENGTQLLPPAFAGDNYDGIVRSEWTAAA